MSTVETSEIRGQKPERGRRKRFGLSQETSKINEGIMSNVDFILGHIPPKRDLRKMARNGTSQVVEINGTPWEISVVNHTVSHDLGMGDPRTRSIFMKEGDRRLGLVTDWKIKTGIGLMRGTSFMIGLDSLPLNIPDH